MFSMREPYILKLIVTSFINILSLLALLTSRMICPQSHSPRRFRTLVSKLNWLKLHPLMSLKGMLRYTMILHLL